MEKDNELLAELTTCEELVWDALVEGDIATDEKMLHADFLGVYSTGFATRDEHSGQLDDGPTVTRYKLTGHRVMRLGRDHAVLCYRADFLRAGQQASEAMYVSSIWQRGPDGWRNVFSQDTTARE
ncbi:nuclear transport factor 2 family protein [Sulfitobacter sp. G21635-S1]|uniref:nuclear transport factor 2 family protein n=1 Tax=Sulfitobacter sp. G21635-S1 TaxID=3014043 RepID=UPI0022AF44F9|nr:nuclear transport factor 2 family protein [Sulfitobacter sp. G21635-S1]MCZ4258497.1 nuclear transport factor 2 family protein [Sulfitobacter sp. G21635-S1]